MPRRREVPKREILPDPVYNSQLVTKFINSLMSQGRKSVAERVFYSALKKVEDRAKDDPIKLFKKAVDLGDSGAMYRLGQLSGRQGRRAGRCRGAAALSALDRP